MKFLAIAGPPATELSGLVRWLNSMEETVVTHEGRVLSSFYHLYDRGLQDPWLVAPELSGAVAEAMNDGAAALIEGVFRRIASSGEPAVCGDAHAHYLDLSDKPGFRRFFRRCFSKGALVAVLDDPVRCVEAIVNRRWTATESDALDVVARHLRAVEAFAKDGGPFFRFDLTQPADLEPEAVRLLTWMGVDKPRHGDLARLLRPMLEAHRLSGHTQRRAEIEAALNVRHAHWRRQHR